jgi:membrane protein DedA with SNARE-associated domain
MFLSPEEALGILEHYKYIVIFPISILEGPIITVIGGFLVYLGYLNGFLAYFFLALGDLVGDALHYVLGRYYSDAKWFKKIGKYLGYDERREKIVEEHFKKHPGKTVLLAKVSHGIGGFIQIVAGMAKMDFKKFMWFSLIGTIPKALALFFVGYYLGSSYEIINKYLDRFAYIVIILIIGVAIYFFSKKLISKEVIEN